MSILVHTLLGRYMSISVGKISSVELRDHMAHTFKILMNCLKKKTVPIYTLSNSI